MPIDADVAVVAVEKVGFHAVSRQGFKPLPELKKGAEAHYWRLAFNRSKLAAYRFFHKTVVGYDMHNMRHKRQMHKLMLC